MEHLGIFFLHAVGVFFCSQGDFFRVVIFLWWYFPGWFLPIADHGAWMSQTDGQTDNILWHNRTLRSIAR